MIRINIKNINQLGSDRIVNSIEGKKFKNCLIIDFGTATTFDIVKNGVYEGGVIAPGIKLSIQNLNQSTALLPMFDLKNKQMSYGKNTKDALNAGFIWGYDGLINNIISKITSKWKTNYKIILTGGYANLFKKIIKKSCIIDQNITIKGISKVYRETIMNKEELIFCPLGGSGEIGGNMNLYAYGKEDNQKWIIVDMGVSFADDSLPGIDLIMPDAGFIIDKKRFTWNYFNTCS